MFVLKLHQTQQIFEEKKIFSQEHTNLYASPVLGFIPLEFGT
jgi:hypothetical protein